MNLGLIKNENNKKIEQRATERVDFSKVFSVKDLKSDIFGNLLICSNSDEAQRVCKIRLMYDQGSLMQQFPADFMLYHVGYFNTKTGVVESVGVPIPIISIFDISQELKKEVNEDKTLDVPQFKKGDVDVNRSEEPSTTECTEDIGQGS